MFTKYLLNDFFETLCSVPSEMLLLPVTKELNIVCCFVPYVEIFSDDYTDDNLKSQYTLERVKSMSPINSLPIYQSYQTFIQMRQYNNKRIY